MFALKRYALDMISLLFPELCNACGKQLYHQEEQICTKCLFDLPYTDFHFYADNLVAKQLWNRLPFNTAMAMLYFKKGSKVQNLMHALKYKAKTDVGIVLGNLLAQRLLLGNLYKEIDIIIPVPLHEKKLKSRGYNQSEYIAKGLADTLGITVNSFCLYKTKATESQTRKTRYSRFENLEDVFLVKNIEQLENKHVLLVDDVVTTGSTFEACGNALWKANIKNLSFAALAFSE
ncbi:ComF family protein [Pedobacter montanisoli]|uniref:ComF family protein n=1 Tax=Pedobacter montanisoli TaxID=2923277 RepID=A0ABS9ZSB2_9SPHI|nr:ComF family protein [Pedobacter montanisoli]MCJ0741482.1 ComF family protein [Pedobacter montanisoli]